MVKPVRKSELAIRPNCEGIYSTLSFAVSRKGGTPWLEMNMLQGIPRLGW